MYSVEDMREYRSYWIGNDDVESHIRIQLDIIVSKYMNNPFGNRKLLELFSLLLKLIENYLFDSNDKDMYVQMCEADFRSIYYKDGSCETNRFKGYVDEKISERNSKILEMLDNYVITDIGKIIIFKL